MYLLTFTIGKDLILASAETNGVQAYDTLEEVLKSFESFTTRYKDGEYEGSTSATIGLMNLIPQAVEYNELAGTLQQYLLSENIHSYENILGIRGAIKGVPLDPKFLEGKHVVNVWKEIMIAGGIADPFESEVTNPIKFSI